MGVAHSIHGRISDLGGRAVHDSPRGRGHDGGAEAPEEGTRVTGDQQGAGARRRRAGRAGPGRRPTPRPPGGHGGGGRRPPDVARRGRARPHRGRVQVVATAGGRHRVRCAAPWPRGRRCWCWTSTCPGCAATRSARAVVAAGPPAGAGAVGERGAEGRPGGGQGRRDRLPAEVGVARGAFSTPSREPRRGEAVFTAGLAGLVLGEFRRMASAPRRRATGAARTDRARDRGAAARGHGDDYKQIAARLFISHRTVQNHVQNTLGKLQLHNRVELVRFAIARGLDTPPTPLR